jgi:hypothetical protein
LDFFAGDERFSLQLITLLASIGLIFPGLIEVVRGERPVNKASTVTVLSAYFGIAAERPIITCIIREMCNSIVNQCKILNAENITFIYSCIGRSRDYRFK